MIEHGKAIQLEISKSNTFSFALSSPHKFYTLTYRDKSLISIMVREIFLMITHSPLFPAHWGLWIPSPSSQHLGKVIHVTGSAFAGFELQFKRNFDPESLGQAYSHVFLAKVDDEVIIDTAVGDGTFFIDTTPVDNIERKAVAIPAPAKSLNSLGDEV